MPGTAGYGPRHGWRRGGIKSPKGIHVELPTIYEGLRKVRIKGLMRIAAPIDADEGENSLISPVAARAPYIGIADVLDGKIKSLRVIRNEASTSPGGAGSALAELLSSMGVRVFLSPNAGPNLLQGLAAAGITLVPVPAGIKFREAVERLA